VTVDDYVQGVTHVIRGDDPLRPPAVSCSSLGCSVGASRRSFYITR
jgi:hypothetical protein